MPDFQHLPDEKPVLPSPQLLLDKPYGCLRLGEFLHRKKLLIAVSGGADSIALLETLVRLRQSSNGLVVAHVEHGIRGDASLHDAAFVRSRAATLNAPYEQVSVDVPKAISETGESIEMAARRLRYNVLRELALKHRCEGIALGHNLNDQAELFFLRAGRGTSLRGLSGMDFLAPFGSPDSALTLVRPFLRIPHADLCRFLREQGLSWREDATNREENALRNRVRLWLLPVFEEIFGTAALATLARTQSLLADDAAFLDTFPDSLTCDTSSNPLDCTDLQTQPPAIFRRILLRWLQAQNLPPHLQTFRLLDSLCRFLQEGKAGLLQAGENYTIQTIRRFAWFSPPHLTPASPTTASFRLSAGFPTPFLHVAPAQSILFSARAFPLHRPLACTLSAAAVENRLLCLRPVCRKDRLQSIGTGNHLCVWDILADFGIPAAFRPRVTILAFADHSTDDHDILWLPGFSVSALVAAKQPGETLWQLELRPPSQP
ncbi:MAG: tRNA lysidine(34) synthetase TilS [Kiritimatiellia bacterium]